MPLRVQGAELRRGPKHGSVPIHAHALPIVRDILNAVTADPRRQIDICAAAGVRHCALTYMRNGFVKNPSSASLTYLAEALGYRIVLVPIAKPDAAK